MYADYALIFKALSDETRLKIVEMISCEEMCACDILEFFHITQPTLSYHMKILTECNLVESRRDGAWMRYRLNKNKMAGIAEYLTGLAGEEHPCICRNYKGEKKCES